MFASWWCCCRQHFRGWLFFYMLVCGHDRHHLLPLCFNFAACWFCSTTWCAVAAAAYGFKRSHVANWLGPSLSRCNRSSVRRCALMVASWYCFCHCHCRCRHLSRWWLPPVLKIAIGLVAAASATVAAKLKSMSSCISSLKRSDGMAVTLRCGADAAFIHPCRILEIDAAAFNNFARANHFWHEDQHMAYASMQYQCMVVLVSWQWWYRNAAIVVGQKIDQ